MSSITIELYDALKSAGVSEEEARKAAKAVSDSKETATKDDLKNEIQSLETRLIKWVLGALGAQTVITLTLIGWMLNSAH